MYLRYFGLQEKPFNITPNPRFVFLSRQHREVFAHLLYGLQSRCGFIEITGEVGAGKTTMLRTLFEQLVNQDFRLALIFNPSLSAEELLAAICREFGLDAAVTDRRDLLDRLNLFLLAENKAGRTVVLVIDEAQNLTAPVLEQIRLLSNLETETDKLIQIVLVGQPELGELLAQPNLRQLSQRIAVRYHLRPMDRRDTGAYVLHRLRIAGALQPEALVSPAALRAIYRASGGLPRLVNVLTDRALLAAYSADRRQVSANDLRLAVRELERPKARNRRYRSLLSAAVTVILLVGGLYAAYLNRAPVNAAPPVASTVAVVPDVASSLIPTSQRLSQFRNGLSGIDEQSSFTMAMQTLTAVCNAEGDAFPVSPQALEHNSSKYSWRWLVYTGDPAALLAFDAPFLLELRLPAVSGHRYLAVISTVANGFQVVPDPVGQGLSADELKALYSGRAWLPWQNYLNLSSVSVAGQSHADVRDVQSLLQQAGLYQGSSSGIYDDATIAAVTRFQAQVGIVQDGRVGPLTLMLLYRQSDQFHPPRLGVAQVGGRP
jgi:general secretion pathway protein A